MCQALYRSQGPFGLQVHSVLLTLGSAVLHDAVGLAQKKQGQLLKIPLPATPAAEAQALVQLLYSQRPESYALGQTIEHLVMLATVCQRFAFQELVSLCDEALTKLCGPAPDKMLSEPTSTELFTPANAAGLYWEARAQCLPHFAAACAHYIGQHVGEVAQAACADALGPVLQAAASAASAASCNRQAKISALESSIRKVRNSAYLCHSTSDTQQRIKQYHVIDAELATMGVEMLHLR